MRPYLLPLLAVAIILPLAALAQSIETASLETFSVSIDPQYPSPLSQADISVQSSSIDLANSTMTVSVAGKNLYKGAVRAVAVQVGKAGSITKVKVTITSAGSSSSQTVSIEPQDVALIAEPVSSSPPLYPGSPLVPLEGDVRVVAVANFANSAGTPLDPSTLSYSWTVDGTQIADSSGIGKQAIIVASPLEYRSRAVSIAITSQDGSLVGGDDLSLTALDPTVRVYENDPLLGILYEHALSGNYTISGAEDTLYAAPFSFPTSNGAPSIQWFLNGNAAQTGNSITLRPTGSGQGSASLSVVASGGQTARATEALSLTFGATPGTGLFGL